MMLSATGFVRWHGIPVASYINLLHIQTYCWWR